MREYRIFKIMTLERVVSMKKYVVNFTRIAIIVVLTVAFNLFSDLKLTADGIIGTNSVIKILLSFLFIFVWLFYSFYSCLKNEGKMIGFLSMVYFMIFICSMIYNAIFLIFSFMIAPFLPFIELFMDVEEFENGNLFYIAFSLLIFFIINIGVALIGTSRSTRSQRWES